MKHKLVIILWALGLAFIALYCTGVRPTDKALAQSDSTFHMFDANHNLGNQKGAVNFPYHGLATMGRYPRSKTMFLQGRDPSIAAGEIHDVWPGGEHADEQHLFYWPQAASTFSVVSDSAADTFGSTGASTVVVRFLNENWDLDEELFVMTGLTPVVSTKKMIRALETLVINTAVFGETTTDTHAGSITVRHIDDDEIMDYIYKEPGLPSPGQSYPARMSCPRGHSCFFNYLTVEPSSNKEVSFFLSSRDNAIDTISEIDFYRARRTISIVDNLTAPFISNLADNPLPFREKTDLWISAKPVQTAGVSSIAIFLMIKTSDFTETGTWTQ